jgi:hypothetical protein
MIQEGVCYYSRNSGETVAMETLRPLTLGELLDRTFQIYKNNFWLFIGIAAVGYLPMFIIRCPG